MSVTYNNECFEIDERVFCVEKCDAEFLTKSSKGTIKKINGLWPEIEFDDQPGKTFPVHIRNLKKITG